MWYAVAVLLLVAGCGGEDPFAPGTAGGVRFDPPPSYREEWARAEACTGRSGDFDRIRWWVIPGVRAFDSPTEGWADGLYTVPDQITLAGGALPVAHIVRHEMIHALTGYLDHPPVFEACRATWASYDRSEAPLELTPELVQYLP